MKWAKITGGDVRFIPAGAGNSAAIWRRLGQCAVHPRRRGEQRCRIALCNLRAGSSPQARGTDHVLVRVDVVIRFIPAGAGNRCRGGRQNSTRTVHPRRRGEQAARPSRGEKKRGSSPQARGTDFRRESLSEDVRFIPAGAGNSSEDFAHGGRMPVHPRRRGEQEMLITSLRWRHGSSPQARGTVFLQCVDLPHVLQCQRAHRFFRRLVLLLNHAFQERSLLASIHQNPPEGAGFYPSSGSHIPDPWGPSRP